MKTIKAAPLVASFLALGAAALYSSSLPATCYSGHPTIEAERLESRLVIMGRVLSSKNVMSEDDPSIVGKTIYSVAVLKTYKGRSRHTISITSENTSSRFPLDVGRDYLLFVSEYRNEYFIDSCGNSGSLDERTSIVKELERKHLIIKYLASLTTKLAMSR